MPGVPRPTLCPADVDVPRICGCAVGLDAYGVSPRPARAGGDDRHDLRDADLNGDPGFVRELAGFNERTGITVEFTPDEARHIARLRPDEPGRRPDVVRSAASSRLGSRTARSTSAGSSTRETLRSDFGDYLLSFGSC